MKIVNIIEDKSQLDFLGDLDNIQFNNVHINELDEIYIEHAYFAVDLVSDPLSVVKSLNDKGFEDIVVFLKDTQVNLIEELKQYKHRDILIGIQSKDYILYKLEQVSNDYYRKFVESMNIMAVVTDRDHKVKYVNPAFVEETGYGLEVKGQKANMLKSGKHSMMFYNNISMSLKANCPWEGTFINKRADESIYKERAYLFPFKVGNKLYYGKAAFNITLEEEIATENKQALALAKSIQRSLLPDDLYEEDIIIETLYKPLEHVSGDIYNCYEISPGLHAVFLADIVGHGVGSSLLSTSIIAIANDLIKDYYMPDVFLNKLNQKIMELFKSNELPQTSYFTAIYMLIDTNEKKIHYANCGHPAFYVVEDKMLNKLIKINFFVGMFQHVNFEYTTYDYEKDTEIFLFTDGLSEIHINDEDSQFMDDMMNRYINGDSQSLIKFVEDDAIKPNEALIKDDISMIHIKVKG